MLGDDSLDQVIQPLPSDCEKTHGTVPFLFIFLENRMIAYFLRFLIRSSCDATYFL
jgi:hypothetical protein